MTTMADLVADARRMAYGSMSEQINLMATSVLANATSFTLTLDVSGITPGTILTSGLNVWYVTSVETSSKSVLVVPKYDSAPSVACAAGDIVNIKPRATAWYLFNTMCDVIRSMSAPANGLYRIGSWTDNVDPTFQTYYVPVEAQSMMGLLGARISVPGTPDTWIDIPAKAMSWQESQNLVRVTRNLPAGQTIEFRYKGVFTTPTAITDDPRADVGLTDSMLDIPALGTVVTLLRTTEGRRDQVQTQGDSRRSGEVGVGANLTAAREFERDYKSRIGEEYTRLTARNPWRQDF
jgi:hypothetical protein